METGSRGASRRVTPAEELTKDADSGARLRDSASVSEMGLGISMFPVSALRTTGEAYGEKEELSGPKRPLPASSGRAQAGRPGRINGPRGL